MKRAHFIIATLVMAPCAFSQSRLAYHQCNWNGLDLRSSYLATAFVDYKQTKLFPSIGIREANPFVEPFVNKRYVNNGVFTAFSVLAISTIDWTIQQLPKQDRPFWYGVAFAAHSFTVTHNRRFGLRGFPLPIPSAWTRPLEKRGVTPHVEFVLD